jgi:hypothetical protein
MKNFTHLFSGIRTLSSTANKIQCFCISFCIYEKTTIQKSKEISNSEQSEVRSDVSATRYIDVEIMERNCMLLSTTYGLNSLYTKKIHVGLQSSINDDDFDFQPCVKLSARGSEGIHLNMVEWQHFQENIAAYGGILGWE